MITQEILFSKFLYILNNLEHTIYFVVNKLQIKEDSGVKLQTVIFLTAKVRHLFQFLTLSQSTFINK